MTGKGEKKSRLEALAVGKACYERLYSTPGLKKEPTREILNFYVRSTPLQELREMFERII